MWWAKTFTAWPPARVWLTKPRGSQACDCGHGAMSHFNLTGSCSRCDCVSFYPLYAPKLDDFGEKTPTAPLDFADEVARWERPIVDCPRTHRPHRWTGEESEMFCRDCMEEFRAEGTRF